MALEKQPSDGRVTARVAVLGTGRMGSAIARRLAEEGAELTIWNRTREHAVALGVGRVADTPARAAAEAEIVFSSLTGPEALREVYLGPEGALASAGEKVFVEMSTAGPDADREIEPAVLARGSGFLAVPILGAPTLMAAGTATLLAGGDPSAFERVRSVLESLGTVRYVGRPADAARLKLIANSLLAIAATGAAELQVAGEAAGLDPQDVFWVLERIAPGLGSRRDGYVGDGAQPTLFALRDLRKDLHLASTSIPGDRGERSLLAHTTRLVDEAAQQTPDEDIAALVRLYRRAQA